MKFNWAYIGAGGIARSTAEAILPTGRHKVASVCNRTFARAEEFAAKYGGKPCRTLGEALATDGVDGAYIATTNDNHHAAAMQCLEAGVPVLLEKPFTINKAEAQELARAARKNTVYLAEAMWTWFSPVARQVRDWLAGGSIGALKNIEISYVNRVSHLYPRLFDPQLGGGALLDIGVYPVAYLYNLLGQPEKIVCKGACENGVDIEEDITFRYSGGFDVTAEVSIVKSPGYENLIITGADGTINCPDYHMAKSAQLIKPGQTVTFEGNGWYDNMFDIVADEIISGKLESDYVPLKNTLDIMAILDECRTQLGLRYPFE